MAEHFTTYLLGVRIESGTLVPPPIAVGLDLVGAAAQTTQPRVRQRIETAAADLDQVLRLLREAVFGLEHRLRGRGLREEIVALCSELSQVPEISFTGPVDGGLQPSGGVRLAGMLREAQP